MTGISPDVAMPGQEIVLKGRNLGSTPLLVTVGGLSAEVKDTQPDMLRIVVPNLPLVQGRKLLVNVLVGADAANAVELTLGRLPLIMDFAPTRGLAGERLTIRGRGFDPRPSGNVVKMGGQPVLVLQASPTELVVNVPEIPTPSSQVQAPIEVQAQGNVSTSSTSFLLMRASSGYFIPRYFAAPVVDHPTHDHAFVSTELGPVLLLTGPADSPSTAERASRVAAALNTLTEQSISKGVAVEPRDDSVAVSGGGVIVTATPADAEAYGEAWDPSLKGRRFSTRTVAGHWAALLHDYFALFVHRERPMRLVEVTTRGRVLSDLYSESQRRSGVGSGVPVGIVRPLSASLAKELRELSLVPPTEGQGKGPGAAEGSWEGTMEETGEGARAIRVRFGTKGSRLVGILTTSSGGVAMEMALSDIVYERGGGLRFVYTTGGAPRQFRGILKGASINGTIHAQNGQEMGRFALRFVE